MFYTLKLIFLFALTVSSYCSASHEKMPSHFEKELRENVLLKMDPKLGNVPLFYSSDLGEDVAFAMDRKIFVPKKFFEKADKEEREFIIAHEAAHILHNHNCSQKDHEVMADVEAIVKLKNANGAIKHFEYMMKKYGNCENVQTHPSMTERLTYIKNIAKALKI